VEGGPSGGGTSTRAFEHLETFAERSRRADERADLIAGLPQVLERGVIYVVCSALLLTLAILYFGRVQSVVETKGTILPEGNILSLQAGQGGVVLEIFARLGEQLPAGAPLLRIDVSEAGLGLAQVKLKRALDEEQLQVVRATLARLDRVLAAPRRVREEANDSAVTPAANQLLNALETAQIRLETALEDQRLLPDRRRQLQREHQLMTQREGMLRRAREGNQQALAAEQEALVRKKEELDNVRRLAENKLLSLVELNAAEERFRGAEISLLNARQRLDQIDVDISNTELRLSELGTQLQTLENEASANARTARVQYEQALASLRQERENAQIQARGLASDIEHMAQQLAVGEGRLVLGSVTMPVAGTIADLKVRAPGEIVAAGSVVATVVPTSVPLIVETTVTNKDMAFVRPGIDARVKVDAFPFQQFGTARARVEKVLPAVGGNSSFVVQLELLDQKLTSGGLTFHLFPGLTVQADLITGRERLLDVLLRGQQDVAEAKGQ
jgi:HlyD family secretion protein